MLLTKEASAHVHRVLSSHEQLRFLHRSSLQSVIEREIFSILQPIFSMLESSRGSASIGTVRPDCFDYLLGVVETRIDKIADFLVLVVEACAIYNLESNLPQIAIPYEIQVLAGDSHNGGLRPLRVKREDGTSVVLKLVDPRPYHVTASTLGVLSSALSVDLVPPNLFSDANNRWYFVEYLEDGTLDEVVDVASFMFRMGALTAVAFALGFVDLHLENIIASGAKPIIIDPECIFYNFDGDGSISERLLSTGLLSHNVHMSALRGGVSRNVPLLDFSMHVAQDGVIRYRKPVRPHRNKVQLRNGDQADPADFRHDVLSGYRAANSWFVKNYEKVCEIIEEHVADDFRIRYLARKTRHYSSVIHMLNLPVKGYADWTELVFTRFRNSGHFPSEMSASFVNAEIDDLRNRDIPYFWVHAGEDGAVLHRTGSVHQLRLRRTPKAQAIQDIQMLRVLDLDEQISVLDDFLNIDIAAPIKA